MAVLGCGAVGTAFAVALDGARPRPRITVWSRSEASVARLLRAVALSGGAPDRLGIATTPAAALGASDVALVCVSDAALAELARELAKEIRGGLAPRSPRSPGRRTRSPSERRPVVLVASGHAPLARLAPLARAGLAVGRLHPLLPLLPGSGAALVNAPFGLEGPPRARDAARELVRLLEGLPLELRVRPGAAGRYHAGAALLGGGLVALLHLAERTMGRSVRARRGDLLEALLVFCEEVAANVRLEGPARALTGPVARGSVETVRAHLEALRAVPGAADAYRALGRTMLALARERGGLDPAAARELERLFGTR